MAVSAAELKVILSAQDQLSGAIKNAEASLANLDKAAQGSGKTLAGLGEGIAKLTTTAAIGAVGGLALGLGAAVKSASDFEHAISGISAVSGATASDLEAIRSTALQLGADTKFSATEAANGMEELVKAGVSMSDVMGGAARASLDLAAAGEVSVSEAATIASNAMNAFGISGGEMGHVADVIAGAANASAIDVHEFGFSLAAAGAVANTVGFSFEDLAQGIAVMGQAGIKGSDAGTSLKTMMLNLQPTTDKQISLFKELGLLTEDGANKFFDATGKVKSMADVAQTLQDALGGMTEQQRLATLEVIFGSDAIRAGAVLTKAGAAGFNQMADAMSKVTAQQVAEERLNNLQGSLEKLKGSLETAAIGIGSAFLPMLKDFADQATELVNNNMPAMTAGAESMAAAFTAAVPVIAAVFQLMVDHGSTIATIAAALATLAIIVTVTGWITGAIAAFSALGATIAASGGIIAGIVAILGGPITVIVFAIVAAVTLLAAAWIGNWGDIQGKTQAVISWFQNAGKTVIDALNAISKTLANWLNSASSAITGWLNQIGDAWTAGWNTVTTFLSGVWDTILTIFNVGLEAVKLVLTIYIGLWWMIFVQPFLDLLTWFNDVFWTPLVTLFNTWIPIITAAITAAWTLVRDKTIEIWTAISTWFNDTFWTPLKTFVTTTTDAIFTVITTAWQAISDKTKEIWDAVMGFLVNTIWTPISTKAQEIFAAIKAFILDQIWAPLKTTTETVWNGIKGFLDGIFTGVQSSARSAMGPVPGIFDSAWSAVKSGVSSVLGGAVDAAKKMFNDILSAADKARKAIEKFISSVGDAASKIPKILKPGSPPPLADGFDYIAAAIGRAASAASTFSGVVGGIPVTVPGTVSDWISQAVAITGVPQSWIGALSQLAMMESSGNPTAVNPTPAAPGQHATGLMQTIPSTFSAYALPGYNNILNPIDNAIASIQYIKARYGDPFKVLDVWAAQGGYAQGGVVPGFMGQPQRAIVHGGEMVLTPAQQAALLHGSAGGGGEIHIHIDAPVYGVNDMESVVVRAINLAQRRGRL